MCALGLLVVLHRLRRYVAESNDDQGALKTLHEMELRLESRRHEHNLFIQAVSDATDFEKVQCCRCVSLTFVCGTQIGQRSFGGG